MAGPTNRQLLEEVLSRLEDAYNNLQPQINTLKQQIRAAEVDLNEMKQKAAKFKAAHEQIMSLLEFLPDE